VTFAKPSSSPLRPYTAVRMTLDQKRLPSRRMRQPCTSARPCARADASSSSGWPASRSAGRKKLLKFPAVTSNVGKGPLEIRASRSSSTSTDWVGRQVVYNTDGTTTTLASTGAQFYWAGDGHNHWHIRDFDLYQLTPGDYTLCYSGAYAAPQPVTGYLDGCWQNKPVDGAPRRDEVVANINSLVERARAQNAPVIWVQHNDEGLPRGSEDWQYVPELADRGEAEPLVHKNYGDAFEATELESLLAELAVGRLVVTGAQSDACIRSTIHGAFTRGYDVTLVGDAHTTEDLSAWGAPAPELVIAHTNLYWSDQSAPGRQAATVSAADVTFTAAAQ